MQSHLPGKQPTWRLQFVFMNRRNRKSEHARNSLTSLIIGVEFILVPTFTWV